MDEERPTDQPSVADDSALFQELTAPGAGAEPREPGEPPPPSEPRQPSPAPDRTTQASDQKGEPLPGSSAEHMIPTARLREESDARRNAERRAEALQMQVETLLQRFQPQQQPRPRTDMFEDPSRFVQEEIAPMLAEIRQREDQRREYFSRKDAVREHGAQKVDEAYGAMENALRARDPEALMTYQRIERSPDPYGDLMNWHQQRTTFAQIGGDLNAYNRRILDQAMADPDFQAAVIAAARGQAPPMAVPAGQQPTRAPNGQFASSQSSLPSIARVGSTALHPADQQDDVSDEQLFADITSRSAKRSR